MQLNRRQFLASTAAATAAFAAPAIAQGTARVVAIGGGHAGTNFVRALRKLDPRVSITLVEANRTFTALPLSNAVIAGLRELSAQEFGYSRLASENIAVTLEPATSIDTGGRTVSLGSGTMLPYDRLVIAPGIDFRWDAIPGYDEAASRLIPHAYKGAEQIMLLRRQLESMDDGGTVLISSPDNPSRCPPAVYERVSLIAYYLKTRKPRSKVIVLDTKDQFSMQRLFQAAWKELYPEHLEYVALSEGGKVNSVDAATRTLTGDFSTFRGNVVNIVPPQKAGMIADYAGAIDRTGWCPVDPVTLESRIVPNVHVIGDAALTGSMPKSAAAAESQGKACAAAIAKLLGGGTPEEQKQSSRCYSLIAPDYAITLANSFHAENGQLLENEGETVQSALDAPRDARAREAAEAQRWFETTMRETFG